MSEKLFVLDEAIPVDASFANGAKPPACSACRHWHELPRARGADGIVDLSQPVMGECRERMFSLPLAQPQGFQLMAYYQRTPVTFPACGQYREKA